MIRSINGRPRALALLALGLAACGTQTAAPAGDSASPPARSGHRVTDLGSAGPYTWYIDETGLSVSRDHGRAPTGQPLPFQPTSAAFDVDGAGVAASSDSGTTTVDVAVADRGASNWRTKTVKEPFPINGVATARAGDRIVVLARRDTTQGVSIAAALLSSDGGRTWAEGVAPAFGQLASTGDAIYLLPSPLPDAIFVLSGSGWEPQPLPTHQGRDVRYGAPVGRGAEILLPTVDVTATPELRWLSSTHRTWQSGTVGLSLSANGQTVPPAARNDSGTVFVLLNDGSDVSLATSNDAGNTYQIESIPQLVGTPTALAVDISGTLTALIDRSACAKFKSSCSEETTAYTSDDGGATWAQQR